MPPTYANGKICYIEIPATDPRQSSDFYHAVFGWKIRDRGDGEIAFDDGVEEVSGSWRTDRPAYTGRPGVLVHIMVADAEGTLALVIANGGEIVEPIGADPGEITAMFRDPAGNILSIYQERALAGS